MRAPVFHCLERTLIITSTPPNDVQFSHPVADQTHSGAPAMHEMAHKNLFREPAFAPETESAPDQRQSDVEPTTRRPVRRRAGA